VRAARAVSSSAQGTHALVTAAWPQHHLPWALLQPSLGADLTYVTPAFPPFFARRLRSYFDAFGGQLEKLQLAVSINDTLWAMALVRRCRGMRTLLGCRTGCATAGLNRVEVCRMTRRRAHGRDTDHPPSATAPR
jgi:hypothetical protein